VQIPVATLYLFCRRVDSIADRLVRDRGRDTAQAALQSLVDRLDATLAGRPPDENLLWKRLAEVHEEFALDRTPLYELIEGALWDLKGRPIDTVDDLVEYSNLVAGSVGAMMLPFLTETEPRETLEPPARKLGIAMQITNIVRDVGEDFSELNRVYLPSTWLEARGITDVDLINGHFRSGYPALLEQAMSLAEAHYDASAAGINALPFRARTSIGAAARMYREIMNEVRANGYDNLSRRAYVSFRRKLLVGAVDLYEWRKARLRSPESDSDSPFSTRLSSVNGLANQ